MSHLQNCSLKIYLKRALGGGVGFGGQDGCERRIKVFVKIQKIYIYIYFFFFFFFFFFFGGGGRVGGGGGGQGRCEQRSEVFVKIKRKCGGGGSVRGGGFRLGEGSGWM